MTRSLDSAGPFVASGFFSLRTPLLPLGTLTAFGAGLSAPGALGDRSRLEAALTEDRALLLERLRALVRRPEIREALFVASPSLDESIDAWLDDPGDEDRRGVVDALVRYVARMAARPTPFGLFSGCSGGTVGDRTHLELASGAHYRRHTRLDTQVLCALSEALHRDPSVRRALTFRPSDGLYAAAGQLRYAEARTDPATHQRSYHLVSVDRTDYLDAVLELARPGATLTALVDALVARDPEIGRAEAEEFVDSLVESQILVSDLGPPITGREPLASLVELLGTTSTAKHARRALEQAGRALAELDACGLGQPSARYRDVATSLRELRATAGLTRLFHADLYKPAPGATIGDEPLRELERAAALLARVASRSENELLRNFRGAFAERYGERMEGALGEHAIVPLAIVLDEEVGIGFGDGLEPSPLLDGLELPPDPSAPRVPFGPHEERLVHGLAATLGAGRREWALDERDIVALERGASAPLPDAFAVMATIAARSREALAEGNFRIVAPLVTGPSGAILLGRFCHGDPRLSDAVQAHLRAEEALRPDAVFAEIVHLPEGRTGNLLCRPVLRSYEIPFLGRSGAPTERQLPIGDLGVTLSSGRVVLWSRRLGREVVPRLTTAHNYPRASLGIYRFLCALQSERERNRFGWSWGPLASAPLLPRVTCGRIVLSLARWNLGREEIDPLVEASGAERFRRIAELRERRGLPRWISLVEHDRTLPIDLDNVLSCDSWLRLVRQRPCVTVQELLPAEDELVVHGPEGGFAHEIVVPFVRRAPSTRVAATRAPSRVAASPRSFPPGSEWLYAKIYAGTASVDRLLAELVRPVVDAVREAKAIDRWFFVRYRDPRWHVRLRFRGAPDELGSTVLPMLREQAAPFFANGRIWRVDLSTYEREIERYGGDDGIDLAEEWFEADSDAVLSIVEHLDHDDGHDARWRLAMRGCHLLLADLGIDGSARVELLRTVRGAFAAEHRVDKAVERRLGHRFRPERRRLEAVLASPGSAGDPLDGGFGALEARSARTLAVCEEIRRRQRAGRLTVPLEAIASSLMHMHCNRLLRASQRKQELVLYDWLLRLYESEAARTRVDAR